MALGREWLLGKELALELELARALETMKDSYLRYHK